MNLGEIGLRRGRQARSPAQFLRELAIALGFVAWLTAPMAVAQVPPGTVNPVPQGSPIPRVLPPAPPSIGAPSVIPPVAAPGAEVPNKPVRVDSVAVEGVTAYPPAEITGLTTGLVGPSVPLPTIDAARQAILQRYRSDGFVLTTVSVRLDSNYHLNFVVTEGRIASVKLDGDIGPGWHPGAALPKQADGTAADQFGDAGAVSAARTRRARGELARGVGAFHGSARSLEPDRSGEAATGLRLGEHR